MGAQLTRFGAKNWGALMREQQEQRCVKRKIAGLGVSCTPAITALRKRKEKNNNENGIYTQGQ